MREHTEKVTPSFPPAPYPYGSLREMLYTSFNKRVIIPLIEKGECVITGTPIDYPPHFFEEIEKLVREGYLIIIGSNHRSHVDGSPVSIIQDTIMQKVNPHLPADLTIRGGIIIVAEDLVKGQQGHSHFRHFQGPLLQTFYHAYASIIRQRHSELLPIQREGIPNQTPPSDQVKNLKPYRELIHAMKEKKLIMCFFEGSVTGGRKRHWWKWWSDERNGLQPPRDNSFEDIFNTAIRSNRKVAYIPVGITGTEELLNPDTRLPSLRILLVDTWLNQFFKATKPHLKFVVDNPLRVDREIASTDNQLCPVDKHTYKKYAHHIEDLFMRSIANLLPEGDRGMYKSKVVNPGTSENQNNDS